MKTLYVMAFIATTLFVQSVRAQAVDVRGGNQVLAITTALDGSEPLAVVNTNSTLRYTQQNRVTKVTVQTSCPSQAFTLTVLAINVPQGTPAPEVMLSNGMPATDFITNIPRGTRRRTCRLQYTASATFAQGNSAEMGNDVHTVTYTLVRQ